jgi:hypothetical protein
MRPILIVGISPRAAASYEELRQRLKYRLPAGDRQREGGFLCHWPVLSHGAMCDPTATGMTGS